MKGIVPYNRGNPIFAQTTIYLIYRLKKDIFYDKISIENEKMRYNVKTHVIRFNCPCEYFLAGFENRTWA